MPFLRKKTSSESVKKLQVAPFKNSTFREIIPENIKSVLCTTKKTYNQCVTRPATLCTAALVTTQPH